jgi:hypothetical protein
VGECFETRREAVDINHPKEKVTEYEGSQWENEMHTRAEFMRSIPVVDTHSEV